jgi:hypothetical protein
LTLSICGEHGGNPESKVRISPSAALANFGEIRLQMLSPVCFGLSASRAVNRVGIRCGRQVETTPGNYLCVCDSFGPPALRGLPLVAVAAFRGPQVEISYDAAFLADLPAATGDAEWECLARAIYFEARGETIKGQFAVAEVILNRVKSSLYPSTICRVVHQAGGGSCQFSFTCDGHSDKIRERDAYTTAGKIARLMLDGAPRALTQGATHFHTRNVRPGWAHRMPRTAMIGQHLFYRVASSR